VAQKNTIQETFNNVADVYDSKELRFFTDSAKYLASIIPLRGHESVIDIATGTGNAALAVASHVPRGNVTGIDFSGGMLEQARKKAFAANIKNTEFIEMDMQSIDFPPATFDAAICAFGIFFVEDMDTLLSRIVKIIKPGGVIAICNFHESYFNPLRTMMADRLAQYNVPMPQQAWINIATETGCRKLFENAGITDIRVEHKNMGYFLADENEWWNVIWNAGFRMRVSQLKPVDLERFRQEHLKEVSALKSQDGLWLDIGVLYTTGRVK
jgi:ubiquinone/menaquinone biosynthesis C-methylase UbiE